MGMMSSAMAGILGGISGGAQAASASVATSLKAMHDQALLRMQEDAANQRQGTQIQAEKDIESQKETYETAITNKKLAAASAFGQRKLTAEQQENALSRTSRENIAKTLANPRQAAVEEHGREFDAGGGGYGGGRGGANGNQAPLLTKSPNVVMIPGAKQYGGQAAPAEKLPIYYMGQQAYIKVPGTTKYMPYDGKSLPNVKSLSRQANPGNIADSLSDPDKFRAFPARYGYLDESQVLKYSKPWKPPAPGVPRGAPIGSTYGPPPERPILRKARWCKVSSRIRARIVQARAMTTAAPAFRLKGKTCG
jgi:hypothetical protein